MRRLVRICLIMLLVYTMFLTLGAKAVMVGGSQALVVFSEPGAMIVLGSGLIGLANFARRKLYKKR